jgi:hypothetical protein
MKFLITIIIILVFQKIVLLDCQFLEYIEPNENSVWSLNSLENINILYKNMENITLNKNILINIFSNNGGNFNFYLDLGGLKKVHEYEIKSFESKPYNISNIIIQIIFPNFEFLNGNSIFKISIRIDNQICIF